MSRSLSFAAFSVALLACGKPGASSNSSPAASATLTSAAAPKGGSCNEAKAGICTEYSDNPLGIAESACKEMFAGTYAKAACPSENVLGYCTKDKGDKQYYYFGNGVAAWVDDAKKDCEQNPLTPGKFTVATTANIEQLAKDKALPTSDRIAGSCVHKDGSCDDVVGRMAELEKQFCEDAGGKFGTTACSADALVGSCVKHGKVSRFYSANLKTNTVKQLTTDCEDSLGQGHWYEGPAAPKAAVKPAKPAKAKK